MSIINESKAYYDEKIKILKSVRDSMESKSEADLIELSKSIINDGIKMYEVMKANVRRKR